MGFSLGRGVRGIAGLLAAALLLGGCSVAGLPAFKPAAPKAVAATAATPKAKAKAEADDGMVLMSFAEAPARVSSLDGLIGKYAALYDIPESLLRRVIARESGYNPRARNGPYLGLMQIRHDTARSMGFAGSPAGLLDAETNLKYAGKYLRGAYVVSGYNSDKAMRLYASGYYYDAKRQGLLEVVGLR